MGMKKKEAEKKASFVRLTRLDGSPIWLNASFVVTIEPRKGGGSVVVPIGDGLDYDVREAPEAVLAYLDGAPVPEVVPVPTSDALTPTPEDVSPEGGRDEAEGKGVGGGKSDRKPTGKSAARKRVEPGDAASAQGPAGTAAGDLLESELVRLRKMAPRTLKKLQNTIMTQFKSVNAEAAVASLVTRGILTIDGTRVNWLEPEVAVKTEIAAPATEAAPQEPQPPPELPPAPEPPPAPETPPAPHKEKKPTARTGRAKKNGSKE